MSEYEREEMAERIFIFYKRLSQERRREFAEDFYGEVTKKERSALLEKGETAKKLVAKMDAVFAALPLDFPNYEKQAQIITDIHSYVKGTATIFPERKEKTQIEDK